MASMMITASIGSTQAFWSTRCAAKPGKAGRWVQSPGMPAFHRPNSAGPAKYQRIQVLRAQPQTVQPGGAIIQPGQLQPLDIAAWPAPQSIVDVHDYGPELAANKVKIFSLCDELSIAPQRKAVILAMAMLETTLMKVSQRDSSKDGTPAANVTCLNLNYDMLNKVAGYTSSDYGSELNSGDAGLKTALGLLNTCFDRYGIQRILDYQRGGATGFADDRSYDCLGYRTAIATVYDKFNHDPLLLNDGRRVEINVQYE